MKFTIATDSRIKTKTSDLLPEQIIIRINGTFDETMTKNFSEDFSKAHQTGQPFIPIIIDSYGGQVYSLLEMISIIQTSKLPIITVCSSKAMSCGAILFCFGSDGYRFLSPHATFMFHEVSSIECGKNSEIQVGAKEVERLNDKIFELASIQIGQKKDFFHNLVHQNNHADLYLDAKICKKYNICNHIGVPEVNVDVDVKYKISANNESLLSF